MEDMEEITFAGQKYYLPKEQVNFYRNRIILATFKQNYFTEEEYSKFIFKYGKNEYTISGFSGLTSDMVSNMIENGEDSLKKFYKENVKIEKDERKITFISAVFDLDSIDDKVKEAFKEQAVAYFKKRFFPEIEEDFKFLSKRNVSCEIFYELYNELGKNENRIKLINERKKELEDKLKEKKELNLKDEDETKIYIDIQDMRLVLKQANLEKNNIFHELIFYIKKLNILGRFGVNEFKFAQLELDLQIKFLALMSIYKKSEPINSIIKFFNSDLLTEVERNNFIKKISDEFLEERADKDFGLKSKVVGQIGINQTTNEVMFKIIINKLLNLNDEDKNQFIDKLEKFANYDENLYVLAESLGDSVKFNRPEFEIFFKYSYSEMIKKIIYAYNFDSNFVEKDITLVKFDEKIYENENLKNKILWLQEQSKIIIIIFQNIINSSQWNSINSLEQMLREKEMEILDCVYNNDKPKDRKIYIETFDKAKIILDKKIAIELITENLIKILLKGTESVENLKSKEQIILTNAQKIFDDIHNDKVEPDDKVEPGRREIYRKALAKAMDLAEAKIYTEYFINDFRKYTSKRWWQREKTMEEKLKIVNDIYTNSVEGKSEMQIEALTKAKRIVTNELLSKEYERLNEETNEFAMNNSQTSEEIFDLGEKLDKDINSSSQPENVKKSLLEKVNDIGRKKFENIPLQQINSDFKFFTRP